LFRIARNCQIHSSVKINVNEGSIGEGSIVREGAVIEGTYVEIGREAIIGRRAYVGGGSAFVNTASLKAGDWLHMGIDSHINIAMGVSVGHSLGLGTGSKIFTHGAYLDSFNLGAPSQWGSVTIGDNVWLPHAWVNPGVNIGSNVVIAAMSLVNQDIPTGSLAGGIPIKILKKNYLPKILSEVEKKNLMDLYISQLKNRSDFDLKTKLIYNNNTLQVIDGNSESRFNLQELKIEGDATKNSTIVKDQLRRNGVRFRFAEFNGKWVSWEDLK